MDHIAYLLHWDDDAIPLDGSVTLGNHLDNDIVVAGEDVGDYHLRIEVNDRGPVAIPLVNATVTINGREADKPVQLMLGDQLSIGQEVMQIGVELQAENPQIEGWYLVPSDAGDEVPIRGDVSIGRSQDADVILANEHISRLHARLVERYGAVWLQDFNSANGTRINGHPLIGGARLYHGDFVAFDKIEYQLVGRGADLTPIATFEDPLRGTAQRVPAPAVDTTEFMAVDDGDDMLAPAVHIEEAGAFLIGITEPVEQTIFRLAVGESTIGRREDLEVPIDDNTVSMAHARIDVRPEGVRLTNLMSTNGTRVNGGDIVSVSLADGDVIRLGRVGLVFKEVPPDAIENHPLFKRVKWWVLGATGVVGIVLLWQILF